MGELTLFFMLQHENTSDTCSHILCWTFIIIPIPGYDIELETNTVQKSTLLKRVEVAEHSAVNEC